MSRQFQKQRCRYISPNDETTLYDNLHHVKETFELITTTIFTTSFVDYWMDYFIFYRLYIVSIPSFPYNYIR